ncbi:hypothetical protein Sjap_018359 [Stephania japonica]|uniref:Uncharacterized protein n=1 Tax=Stephania japonica TaxID=461633 RepID=A0AAP0I7U8_9MAGN
MLDTARAIPLALVCKRVPVIKIRGSKDGHCYGNGNCTSLCFMFSYCCWQSTLFKCCSKSVIQ